MPTVSGPHFSKDLFLNFLETAQITQCKNDTFGIESKLLK